MRHFLFEDENNLEDSKWKHLVDHDEGGNVLNDPILKRKVIYATRLYFLQKFDIEDALVDVQVSIENTTKNTWDTPNYEVKVVAVFTTDMSSKEVRVLNKKLEYRLDSDGEGREVTANFSLTRDGYARLEYVGPGIFDNAGAPFETREDYLRGVMIPIKKDFNTIYKVLA